MKKSVLVSILCVYLLLGIMFVSAQTNGTNATVSLSDTSIDLSGFDDGYKCLNDKVKGNCNSLSTEEKIFSVLATGVCRSELESEKSSAGCFPSGNCQTKLTAQAILALDELGVTVDDSKAWLLSQNETPEDVIWYLQIESNGASSCSIEYDGSSHNINIASTKKIDSGAGSCLSLSENGWWLSVSPSCFGKDFAISCNQAFQTSLLFKQKTSSVIHVLETTQSASAEGKTTERISSSCFTQGGVCNYEASLWSALAMYSLGEDISSYMPYLLTGASEHASLLPSSFLFSITGYTDFRNELLEKSKGDFWDESGDKFFDTALAAYAFQYEEPQAKVDAKKWILEVQDDDGCWQGSIKNTAFLLHAFSPRTIRGDGGADTDCLSSGYFCMSEVSCEGTVLKNYGCAGVSKCCDTQKSVEPCGTQGGSVCNSGQICAGGSTVDAKDLESGQTCCIAGSCTEPREQTACESNYGSCKLSCGDGETESSYACDFGDTCCMSAAPSSSGSSLWILVTIFIILIILIILGIIFREKLAPYWIRIKSRFSKGGPQQSSFGGPRPRFPPASGRIPMRGPPMQRRILPPTGGQQPRPMPTGTPAPANRPAMNDVLSKLKEMGK